MDGTIETHSIGINHFTDTVTTKIKKAIENTFFSVGKLFRAEINAPFAAAVSAMMTTEGPSMPSKIVMFKKLISLSCTGWFPILE